MYLFVLKNDKNTKQEIFAFLKCIYYICSMPSFLTSAFSEYFYFLFIKKVKVCLICSDRNKAAFQSNADVGLNAGAFLPAAAGQAVKAH